eukprot:CAMPEP_0196776838 /NCGR_PEP_ID=MMETSP1104-20130614/4865_1 /TAXON_ID=33652 /ORGANISM="Cafeteria sp., Strain Caron Lab Isolate" /LENGTH=440 /DNA_ID=CAMNT_0042147005 /DNA_START=67 /DNA_END=1385 /DNA_ORIENTATION=-
MADQSLSTEAAFAEVEDLMGYMPFAYMPESNYNGTVQFHIVMPSGETVPLYIGASPDEGAFSSFGVTDEASCVVTAHLPDFLRIYSGKVSATELASMCWRGRVKVHGMAFSALTSFAKAFNYEPDTWVAYYRQQGRNADGSWPDTGEGGELGEMPPPPPPPHNPADVLEAAARVLMSGEWGEEDERLLLAATAESGASDDGGDGGGSGEASGSGDGSGAERQPLSLPDTSLADDGDAVHSPDRAAGPGPGPGPSSASTSTSTTTTVPASTSVLTPRAVRGAARAMYAPPRAYAHSSAAADPHPAAYASPDPHPSAWAALHPTVDASALVAARVLPPAACDIAAHPLLEHILRGDLEAYALATAEAAEAQAVAAAAAGAEAEVAAADAEDGTPPTGGSPSALAASAAAEGEERGREGGATTPKRPRVVTDADSPTPTPTPT